MTGNEVRAQRRLRAPAAAFLIVATILAVPASAQLGLDFVSATPATEKVPRTAGDWVVWTSDEEPVGSWGTVLAKHLPSGVVHVVGAGFLPDVDSYAATKGGGAGVPPPGACSASVTRVAWLRHETDGTFSVLNACYDGSTWTTAVLQAGLAYADHVRVAGNYTAWCGSFGASPPSVTLHDGSDATVVSSAAGGAFRPALARSGASFALVWDEYVGGPGQYDYEVYGIFKLPTGPWSAVQNLSLAPKGIDLVPAVAIAPDGSAWVAWESDRGTIGTHPFVVRRRTDGQLTYPKPYPPSADPAKAGNVAITGVTAGLRPALHVEPDGRLWLLVETKFYGPGAATWEKFIVYSSYSGDAWSVPGTLPGWWRTENWVDTETATGGVRVVYEMNAQGTSSMDIATVQLDSPGAPVSPVTVAAAWPAAAPKPQPKLALPAERTVVVDGVARQLVFADLHSHSGHSPDALGERDQCLFYARDVARLDVWASTDHDEGLDDLLMDWEYAQGLRQVALFDAPGFTTFMGYEWTNYTDLYLGETTGHRATIGSSTCYRYTDVQSDELPEYYALMAAEDAIGVPHHLSFFGGTTFLLWSAFVQPVTEVSSVHGVFEDTLMQKLIDHPARFGITSAGDNHTATPGFSGVAGILIDPALEPHAAVKAALRQRLSFGARRDGMYLDMGLNDRPFGAEMLHAGPSLLRYRLAEVPGSETLNVNISRNGDWAAPLHQRAIEPGCATEVAVLLPAESERAFYMLRVTRSATGLDPLDTLLWSSPIWIDPEPAVGYPVATVSLPPSGSVTLGTPFNVVFAAIDPQGVADLDSVRLHVTLDGLLVATLDLPQLLATATVAPVSGGLQFRYSGLQLHQGEWGFFVDARDGDGHYGVAGGTVLVTP